MNTRDVTDKLQDWQKQAQETAKDFGETADNYLRENTWSAIAGAAILGCVVGFLLGRRD